ncbi:hypothetical protein ABGB17_31770, partial [Sphaerisporangium sp. B11E5]
VRLSPAPARPYGVRTTPASPTTAHPEGVRTTPASPTTAHPEGVRTTPVSPAARRPVPPSSPGLAPPEATAGPGIPAGLGPAAPPEPLNGRAVPDGAGLGNVIGLRVPSGLDAATSLAAVPEPETIREIIPPGPTHPETAGHPQHAATAADGEDPAAGVTTGGGSSLAWVPATMPPAAGGTVPEGTRDTAPGSTDLKDTGPGDTALANADLGSTGPGNADLGNTRNTAYGNTAAGNLAAEDMAAGDTAADGHAVAYPYAARDGRRDWVSWVLEESLASIPLARRLVRGRLTDWGLEEDGDVAELLVTELVANALRHAVGAPVVTLIADGSVLRCQVRDASTERPHLLATEIYDETGRGLHLVDLLARHWGVTGHPGGKSVWFDLAAHPRAPGGT